MLEADKKIKKFISNYIDNINKLYIDELNENAETLRILTNSNYKIIEEYKQTKITKINNVLELIEKEFDIDKTNLEISKDYYKLLVREINKKYFLNIF